MICSTIINKSTLTWSTRRETRGGQMGFSQSGPPEFWFPRCLGLAYHGVCHNCPILGVYQWSTRRLLSELKGAATRGPPFPFLFVMVMEVLYGILRRMPQSPSDGYHWKCQEVVVLFVGGCSEDISSQNHHDILWKPLPHWPKKNANIALTINPKDKESKVNWTWAFPKLLVAQTLA